MSRHSSDKRVSRGVTCARRSSSGALEPGDEPLRVELEIHPQDLIEALAGQGDSVRASARVPERAHLLANCHLAVGIRRVTPRERGELTHLRLERLADALQSGDAAEVHEKGCLRRELENAVDRGDQLLRVELRRRRRRQDERARRGVELAVGETERIAGEDVRVSLVEDRAVMQRVAGRIDGEEPPSAELDALAVAREEDALARNRRDLAIERAIVRFAVDGDRGRDQPRGIGEVRRAARVHHGARIGQLGQQNAGASGMVQVHVGEQNEVDRGACDAEMLERGEQPRHRIVGAYVDEGGMPSLDDEMGGGEAGANVARVDRRDAVRILDDRRLQHAREHSKRMSRTSHSNRFMNRSAAARGGLALTLALATCFAPRAARPAPETPAAFDGEQAKLVLEGIPAADTALAARLQPYLNVRWATFLDWLPDGSMLIATRFGSATQVHRLVTPLGEREQLTFFSEPVTVAAAPQSGVNDGFAFLKDRDGDGNAQVYYYRFADHSVRELTDGKSPHGGLLWSRDGKHFVFFGTERDRASYDIYEMDTGSTAAPHLIVAGHGDPWYPVDWSADGRKLLLLQTRSLTAGSLYLADVSTGSVAALDIGAPQAAIRAARFAPDGRGIYIVSDSGGDFAHLEYFDPVTHAVRPVTGDIPWDVDEFDVSADGRYVAYVVNEDGASRLTVLDVPRKVRLSPAGLPAGVISTLKFDASGRRLALTAEGPESPRDVYVYDLGHDALVRWTRSEPGPLDPATFVTARLIHFPTWDRVDGARRAISAYLYSPRAPGPHPVLVDIHDGPEQQSKPTFDPFVQFVVNELGYAVVAPNVRGSSGYGRRFLALDDGPLREDAVRDIGSLLVWIDLQPDLDRRRVVLMGDAYGGYLALASLAAYDDRLKGAIDIDPITNLVSFLAGASPARQWLRRAEFGDERDPRMRDYLASISPLDKVKWIRKPLFVALGLNDPTVRSEDAEELVAALRARGNEVWYLAAKDEGSGFLKEANRDAFDLTAAMFLKELSR